MENLQVPGGHIIVQAFILVKILRDYGSQKKYYNQTIGYNMRVDELQAALLSVKLQKLNEWINQRQEISIWCNKELANIPDLILPKTAKNATHAYHLYVVRTSRRNELQQYLHDNGVGTLIIIRYHLIYKKLTNI